MMDKLISQQAAIDTLLGITAMRNTIPLDSAIFNIKKLPSAEPERKGHGCEYCCEDSDGYVLSIEKNGHAYIQNGKLALRAKGWWGECAINFCPMCGRKLRGEENETD